MPNFLVILLISGAPAKAPEPNAQVPLAEVRRVIASLVQTAEENRAQANPLAGDELADHYVRQAANFTAKEKLSSRAYLVALGIALDPTDQLRGNRLTRWFLKQVEPDAERTRRLKALGKPTLKGREDWLAHFAVSASLTAYIGPLLAEKVGIGKELRDARGSSGFSFADLAADNAGICFARTLLNPGRDVQRTLANIAANFRGDAHMPQMNDLEDGVSWGELTRKYGDLNDPRFTQACQSVRDRVEKLPLFKNLSREPRGKKDP